MTLLSFTLGETKTYFESVPLVFFVDVLNKGLEVFRRFIGFGGFSSHHVFLKSISVINYNISRKR